MGAAPCCSGKVKVEGNNGSLGAAWNAALENDNAELEPLGPEEPLPIEEERWGEHTREWQLIGNAIEAAQLSRLRQLRKRMRCLDGHPACQKVPRTQQPYTLLRFLRARQDDVVAADRMLRKMLQWRASFRMDARIAAWRQDLATQGTPLARAWSQYSGAGVICKDRHGLNVVLSRGGGFDTIGWLREFEQEQIVVATVNFHEDADVDAVQHLLRTGELVFGRVEVLDVADYDVPGWGWRAMNAVRYAFLSTIMDTMYPETIRTIMLIRFSPMVQTAFNMCYPLLAEGLKKKLVICGRDPEEWLHKLRAEVPPETEFPAYLETADLRPEMMKSFPSVGLLPEGIAKPREGDFLRSATRRLASGFSGLTGSVMRTVITWQRCILLVAIVVFVVRILQSGS